MYLVASITGNRTDSIQSKVKEDFDIERELKLLNKSPVKSIQTKFGYIVDCIDINKQPAFDHPLLTNHKLQRKPSFQNKIRKTSVKNSSTKAIFGLEKHQCPTGTVAIRRTTKEDLIQGKSYFNNVLFEKNNVNHVAQVVLSTLPNKFYYGVGGTASVYNVKVENDQSSASMMWVRNGPIGSKNSINVGWHVSPQLYKNDATYLFAVWTTDGYKNSGCFNYLCQGFVQTSKQVYLGVQFGHTSIYGGTPIDLPLKIIQDSKTKNWWLINDGENIGYFPASLFSNLTSADQVGWGGRTTTSLGGTSPPMGSGYFPDNVLSHASYFIYITYRDNDSRENYEPDRSLTNTFSDKPNCYTAEYYGEQDDVGHYLQFGGPGGNCGN
ncbi:hypothetical protein QL285_029062 [Trifolium repens]|nr:hypothetical protein QL285_029062 [Trifolium repens]